MHCDHAVSMKTVLYLTLLILTSCAIPTSPKVDYIDPENETLDNLALLYVYRTKQFFGERWISIFMLMGNLLLSWETEIQ